MKIQSVPKDGLTKALDLVNAVFDQFVAVDYGDEGQKTFQDYLKHKAQDIEEEMTAKTKKIWGAYQHGRPIGIIALKNTNHISLLFVDPNYHCQGVAKRLFSFLRGYLAAQGQKGKITVNSSPYAVEVYRRLGFKVTDSLQEQNGIKYVPMVYKNQTYPH